MTIEFELAQSVLNGDLATRDQLTGPHRRLVDAWLSDQPGPAIAGDVATLISQVLRHERDVASTPTPRIRLRLDDRGISMDLLARSNLNCTRFGLTEHSVTLGENWAPEWLHGDPRWIDVACA